ncbi:hypothetical protein H0H10_00810 [Streptomyces sp. TRM S81-3]|uniref:Uncharacterized protein n=1 Tax=Streptomyces griseicoloratus TaxID=2752516 RepID=A0A926QP66_9ACTN|nr:hypothetical protein [Streptomyces griseicoloratus]
MSDTTPPTGGAPGERDGQAPDARGETALGTSRGSGAEPAPAQADTARDGGLVPREESDRFEQRLQHAVAGFVDGPRAAVEEADHVLEEVTTRITDAVTQRRRTLRGSWQESEETDTERLRLALRDYRELADRLMHL